MSLAINYRSGAARRTIIDWTPTYAVNEWLTILEFLKDPIVREVRIGRGTVRCDATQNMAGYDRKKISMHPECVIRSNLPYVDGHSSTPFYWDGATPDPTTAARIGTSGLNGAATATLTSAVTRSSAAIGRRFTSTGSSSLFAVGDQIAGVYVNGGVNVFVRPYVVSGIVDANTIEVDRQIIYPFAATTGKLFKVRHTIGLEIEGGQVENVQAVDLSWGDRLLQLCMAWGCNVHDMILRCSTTGLPFALDAGPYDCTVERIKAKILANSNYCLVPFEMGEKLRARDLHAEGLGTGTGQAAIAIVSSDDVTVDSCNGQGSACGLKFINNDALDTYGNRNITVLGGTYSGCSIGSEVGSYAQDVHYFGTKFSDNVNAGLRVTATGQRVRASACQWERNGYNFEILGGRGHSIAAGRMEQSTSGHLILLNGASPELSVSDLSMSETTTTNAYAFAINGTGTATLKITRTSADVTKAGGGGGILLFSAADITLDDFECTKSSGTQGNLLVSGGTASKVTLKGTCKAIGASMATGISVGATDTVFSAGDTSLLQTLAGGRFAGRYNGTGAPGFTALKGATYQRDDGGAGTCFYVNEAGTGVWVGK